MNLKNIQFIFKPSYWIMNYNYNKDVDDIINELLDKYEMTDYTEYTVKLGKATIWVENRPYASIRLHGTYLGNYRPSRLTIQKALKRFYEFKRKFDSEKVSKLRSEIL